MPLAKIFVTQISRFAKYHAFASKNAVSSYSMSSGPRLIFAVRSIFIGIDSASGVVPLRTAKAGSRAVQGGMSNLNAPHDRALAAGSPGADEVLPNNALRNIPRTI